MVVLFEGFDWVDLKYKLNFTFFFSTYKKWENDQINKGGFVLCKNMSDLFLLSNFYLHHFQAQPKRWQTFSSGSLRISEELRVQSPVLHIKRSHVRWFGHLVDNLVRSFRHVSPVRSLEADPGHAGQIICMTCKHLWLCSYLLHRFLLWSAESLSRN